MNERLVTKRGQNGDGTAHISEQPPIRMRPVENPKRASLCKFTAKDQVIICVAQEKECSGCPVRLRG